MRDILLLLFELLAIAAAVAHGVLTETKVFPRVTISLRVCDAVPPTYGEIPTVSWIAAGVLLIAAPSMGSK